MGGSGEGGGARGGGGPSVASTSASASGSRPRGRRWSWTSIHSRNRRAIETVLRGLPPSATGLLPREKRASAGAADHQRPASLIGIREIGVGEPAWASAPGAHDPSRARGLRFDAIGRRGGKAKRNATGRDGGPRFRDRRFRADCD